MKKFSKSRYTLYFHLILFYLLTSFLVRITLYALSASNIDFSILTTLKIFSVGLYFDAATAIFIFAFYALYLVLLPNRLIGGRLDKILSYFITTLFLLIATFSFMAEFPFWDEFKTRFNFIAVDYLIYTYEVISNINESYSLPLIIFCLISIIGGIIYLFKRTNTYKRTFTTSASLKSRIYFGICTFGLLYLFISYSNNKQAEWNTNLYVNELSKNGMYSFFAAYRSNELDFATFYVNLPEEEAYQRIKEELKQENQQYSSNTSTDIHRKVMGGTELKPNIILICIESFSADFLSAFGNQQHLTPFYDALTTQSIFFSNLYATGTRTIRGMEALTLCVPPTPGNSIVRRPNNDHLFSIATILRNRHYALRFIYGGDGYFDNMNAFFGGQGFTIIDRNRGNPLPESILTDRISISDNEVRFENAWGICDQDIYLQSLKDADKNDKEKKPFFQFIMTTSNHKPYSFPKNAIDLPQGHREGAVKYTDFAIGEFLKEAKKKPWFANTVFVIVADHCASSAGKWEVNIDKHHIPALIYNLPQPSQTISKLASQIDLMPTLFGYLDWNYETELYGKDINKMKSSEERALIGNYRTVGLLRNNIFTEINDRKKTNQYSWDPKENKMLLFDSVKDTVLSKTTIAYYQTASANFKNGLMKEKKKKL